MHYPTSLLAILVFVGAVQADDSDESWQFHGQVVNEQGTPVVDFEAATFWMSNGNWWDETGELLKEATAGKLWKNEGVLAASPHEIAARLPEGKFNLTINGEPRTAVFAVDKRHEHGGIVLVEQSAAEKPVTITMVPLVRVTAKVYCSGVKLADFRGKWVLLDFWAVWCSPCVYRSLPELTKFYEEHTADRDRFEILAICNTEKEEAHTIEAFDSLAAPFVEKVWAGKPLPFPVLVDGEGRTSSVYGIQSWPTVLLIDPEGHLVKNGNLDALAEKLKEKKP